eukprot:143490-Hanusia_phi.AAC.1
MSEEEAKESTGSNVEEAMEEGKDQGEPKETQSANDRLMGEIESIIKAPDHFQATILSDVKGVVDLVFPAGAEACSSSP